MAGLTAEPLNGTDLDKTVLNRDVAVVGVPSEFRAAALRVYVMP
jgi:hypothetical protein